MDIFFIYIYYKWHKGLEEEILGRWLISVKILEKDILGSEFLREFQGNTLGREFLRRDVQK